MKKEKELKVFKKIIKDYARFYAKRYDNLFYKTLTEKEEKQK